MTTATDAISLTLELLTYLALLPGALLLTIGLVRRAFSSRLEETWAVVIASPAGTDHPWLRWLDLHREMQTSPVPLDEGPLPTIGEEIRVWVDPRHPDRARLEHPSSDGRFFRVLGYILLGVGIGAAIGQLVLLFVEG